MSQSEKIDVVLLKTKTRSAPDTSAKVVAAAKAGSWPSPDTAVDENLAVPNAIVTDSKIDQPAEDVRGDKRVIADGCAVATNHADDGARVRLKLACIELEIEIEFTDLDIYFQPLAIALHVELEINSIAFLVEIDIVFVAIVATANRTPMFSR